VLIREAHDREESGLKLFRDGCRIERRRCEAHDREESGLKLIFLRSAARSLLGEAHDREESGFRNAKSKEPSAKSERISNLRFALSTLPFARCVSWPTAKKAD
jgi:hypothetical protein